MGEVYVWLTHDEAERATLPERVGGEHLHAELAAAQNGGRSCAPADAHYLIRACPHTRLIHGYA